MTAETTLPTGMFASRRTVTMGLGGALLGAPALARATTGAPRGAGGWIDIRRFGAKGDGTAIDSGAINQAIEAATRAGGGTVVVPPGRYLCFSIRLKSNVTIILSAGSVIEAADPDRHSGSYDPPENYMEERFQDFGITHVHNSLFYGDGVENVAIVGQGLIHGVGLDRAEPVGSRWHGDKGWISAKALGITPKQAALRNPKEHEVIGRGNKTIGLINCRNVLLRDFTVLKGGHFCVIAHGVTHMTIDNLTIDTDRDGIDIDCCRDVRVTHCTVNSPKDDAIVLKSSYALGRKVMCEDISVLGCKTSGYAMGSVLDGTYRPSEYDAPDKLGPLGRIKMGTETNGGFRNILISDCTCEHSRGILIGIVDGGLMENVMVSDIVMRDPVNHPLFVHLSGRSRAPQGTGIGTIRHVTFANVTVTGAKTPYACGVSGLPGHRIEDVTFSGIRVSGEGGGTDADAARVPEERPTASLEVSFLGTLPASGFYARHAERLTLRDFDVTLARPDARPAVLLDDVQGAIVDGLVSSRARQDAVTTRGSSNVAVGAVQRMG
ncbi:rhamnogalacturonidase [Stakelama saccharophila]|uniref:Glycosyl hydrolase family 28-related protein n=1 Tax=Stakelama saccharophila TaxID=3075605 RepID=A0ABZ0B689_9SPHN|nr:glycosyl hydrolase family 28-related protein [Stakelama sp. W311]WNO52403.1 glycosyl hydrolase family 28-related protein [Stakelama sp. W311]